MKIGILGGTFDPIHFGHLIMGEECRDFFQLEKIIFIPAKIPPHKTSVHISPETQRLELVQLAIKNDPAFEVNDLELKRPGPSYSIDSIEELNSQGDIYLIIGHDQFQEIETWHRYWELIKKCKIIVVQRPGFAPVDMDNFTPEMKLLLAEKLQTQKNGRYVISRSRD